MRIAALVAALALLWFGPAAAQERWQEFTASKGGFAVQFPGAPAVKEGPDRSGYPDHQYEVETGGFDYFVAYTEYPTGYFASRDANRFLDKMVEGLTRDEGTVRFSRKITIAGNPGREYVVDKSKSTVTAHFFVVGDLLYGQMLFGPTGSDGSAAAKRFFDSFRFVAQ